MSRLIFRFPVQVGVPSEFGDMIVQPIWVELTSSRIILSKLLVGFWKWEQGLCLPSWEVSWTEEEGMCDSDIRWEKKNNCNVLD